MRQYILIILLISSLEACRKKDFSAVEYKLAKIYWNENNDKVGYRFSYDQNGRLISKERSKNDIPDGHYHLISYSGNTLAISKEPYPQAQEQFQVLYQLNSTGKPITRTEKDSTVSINASPYGPQHNYRAEQTQYIYSGEGILNGFSGNLKDSISYFPLPNTLSTISTKVDYSAIYKIENSNLTSVTIVFQSTTIQKESGSTAILNQTAEEKTVFFYDRGLNTPFDSKNNFLMAELSVFPFKSYIPDSHFKNFPNKSLTQRTVRNTSGNIVSQETIVEEPEIKFDGRRYISSVRPVPSDNPTFFTFARF